MTSLYESKDERNTFQEGYGLADLAISQPPNKDLIHPIMKSNTPKNKINKKKVQRGGGKKKIIKKRKQTGRGLSQQVRVKAVGPLSKCSCKENKKNIQRGGGVKRKISGAVIKKRTQRGKGRIIRKKSKTNPKRKNNF